MFHRTRSRSSGITRYGELLCRRVMLPPPRSRLDAAVNYSAHSPRDERSAANRAPRDMIAASKNLITTTLWKTLNHNTTIEFFQRPHGAVIGIESRIAVHDTADDALPPPPIQTEPHGEVYVVCTVLRDRFGHTQLIENRMRMSSAHEFAG